MATSTPSSPVASTSASPILPQHSPRQALDGGSAIQVEEDHHSEAPLDGTTSDKHEEAANDEPESEDVEQAEEATAADDSTEKDREGDGSVDPNVRIGELETELDRVTTDKDHLEAQYRNLLGKLTNMRNTLGEKLKQDADELDRRELQIVNLQAANEDLQETVETLKSELITSNEDADRLHTQVDQLRMRADDSERTILDEASSREAQLREVTEDYERCRQEREEWESEAMKERTEREAIESEYNTAARELTQLRLEKQQLAEELDREQESSRNLQNVLEEFQVAKDRELRMMLGDLQEQLQSATRNLQEYKHRAQVAEGKLKDTAVDSERSAALAKEVKEKNLHIGKLRHEAVILNEHLIEALRQLKNTSGENMVDRRLVTNVLISFFNTPRADSKRFEMLSVLASIMSWSDEDRERVGLQRVGSSGGAGTQQESSSVRPSISLGSSRRRALSRAASAFAGKNKGATGSGTTEESFNMSGVEGETGMEQSFSNLWVEYLLKESQSANNASSSLSRTPSSVIPPLPTSPLISPPISSSSRTISPFAELAPPTSPTRIPSSSSSSITSSSYTAGKSTAAPANGRTSTSMSRSDTDTDAGSTYSSTRTGGGGSSSTAPTSVASGTSK